MAKTVKVPDPLYRVIEQIAEDRDMSKKEAARQLGQEAGYDV